jgi:hypothetical protein
MHVTEEDGRACLTVHISHGGEETCASCAGMVLKVGGDALKVNVVGKQIEVCGSFGRAVADSLTRGDSDGALVLEGHVRMKYNKDGQKAEIAADHVAVNVADGHLEVKPSEKHQQVFEFWTGFFQ